MPRLLSLSTKTRLGVTLVLAALATFAGTGAADADELPSTADAQAQQAQQAQQAHAMAEARKQFHAGVNLLDDPDGAKYEEAYSAFKKAFELSQSPRVLGNMGFCAMHLERDGEAIDAYTKYLSGAPDVPERERAQIVKDLATMTSTVARVRLVVTPPRSHVILVDTRAQTRGPSIENIYAIDGNEITIGIRPGRHTFKVKAEGEESLALDVAIEPAALVTHELHFARPTALTPAPTLVRQSPSVAGPVVIGITGVLAAGGGAAMGVLARNKANAIAARCPNNVCPPEYDLASARTSAKTFGTLADAGMIGGGALVAGALLWYVLLPSSRTTTMASAAGGMCTRDGCALQLQRRF